MPDRRPTRRAFLAAGAAGALGALALAGCGDTPVAEQDAAAAGTSSGVPAAATAAPSASPSAAAASTAGPPVWASAVARSETHLVAVYDAVRKAHPVLKTGLAPLRAGHAAHLKALGVNQTVASAGAVPATPAAALTALAAAEHKASSAASGACVTCPVEGAVLLGSIAAADASYVVLLQSLRSS